MQAFLVPILFEHFNSRQSQETSGHDLNDRRAIEASEDDLPNLDPSWRLKVIPREGSRCHAAHRWGQGQIRCYRARLPRWRWPVQFDPMRSTICRILLPLTTTGLTTWKWTSPKGMGKSSKTFFGLTEDIPAGFGSA